MADNIVVPKPTVNVGDPYTIAATDASGVLTIKVISSGSPLEISLGNTPGTSHVNKFGRNPDCDQAATAPAQQLGRDIWDGGIAAATLWVPPTAARQHNLSSSDDEDGGAGTDTGALTIRVSGLDASYLKIQEDVTLNGTTDVLTPLSYTMIYRMECLTFGSVGWNIGDITALAAFDSTPTAVVTAKNSQTLMAIYQIPAAKTGYLTGWYSDIYRVGGGTKYADIFLMSKKDGGGWRVRDIMSISSDGTNTNRRIFEPYKSLAAKELIKVVADPSATGQDIGAGFDIVLVDD